MTTFAEWRRPRREAWWALAGFSMFFVIIGYLLVDGVGANPTTWDIFVPVLVLVAYSAGGAVLAYRVFAHARVLATDQGLVISNPFRGDQFVAWGDISSIKADRLLIITVASGQRVIAWVIQKNGWSRARHERTAADEAIDEMAALASRILGGPARQFASTAGATLA
jgi:hypothetical protein